MSGEQKYIVPPNLIPRAEDHSYDLEEALASVITVKANIPDDAFTAAILGTKRNGHGILIQKDGMVVTIGYLIAEAQDVWLITAEGKTVAGHVVGYDYDTGFGLVQALSDLNLPTAKIGKSTLLPSEQKLVMAGCGGLSQAVDVTVSERKEFAGYWEYVLQNAIFTTPAHPNWGGAALFDSEGNLCGVGSLFVDNLDPESPGYQGNLSVPTDQLNPIISEICKFGRKLGDPRPWLGFFVSLIEDQFLVVGAYNSGPAAKAGLKAGDVIEAVAGYRPKDLGGLFKDIWKIGPAGVEIPLSVRRGASRYDVNVKSVDRLSLWKSPKLH